MSFLEEARAEQVKHGPQCSVAILLADHPEQADEITELVNAKDVFGSTAAEILSRNSLTIHADAINRHRKRGTVNGCKCPS